MTAPVALTYAERRARMRPRRFPLEPLAAVVGIVLGQAGPADVAPNLSGDLAARLRISARHVRRLHQLGLSLAQADRFACSFGLHPVDIWPAEYDTGREPEPGPPPSPPWLAS